MIKKLWEKYVNRETVSYLIFGVLTTVVDLVIYQGALLLGIHYMAAQWIAWACAVAFAFVTNKFFVFESKSTQFSVLMRELITFVGGRLFSGVITALLLAALVEGLSCPEMVAKLITEVFVIISNYLISKLLIFRKH
ncbi:MAG: GtrA family protein [Lachnospiraceae bacterium]|nr:GtrA family protein [Lachnospiraceae bacterium]